MSHLNKWREKVEFTTYIHTYIKVVLPPPVHFLKYAGSYKTYGGKPLTICMGDVEVITRKVDRRQKSTHRAPRPPAVMSAAMADCRAPVISELDETLRSLTPQGVTKILKAEYTLTKNGKAAFLRDVWARGVGQPESTLRRARGSSLLQGRQRQTCGLAPAPRALRPVRCGQRCLLGAISDPPPYHTATAPLLFPGRACQPRVLDGQQQHLILEMLLGGVGCIIKNKNKNSIFFLSFPRSTRATRQASRLVRASCAAPQSWYRVR